MGKLNEDAPKSKRVGQGETPPGQTVAPKRSLSGREVSMSEMLLRGEVARLQQLLRMTTEALEAYVEHYGDPLKVARAALAKARGENDAR